jgi:hypothetical protein
MEKLISSIIILIMILSGCNKKDDQPQNNEEFIMTIGETESLDVFKDINPTIIFPSPVNDTTYEDLKIDVNNDSIYDFWFMYGHMSNNTWESKQFSIVFNDLYYLADETNSHLKIFNNGDLIGCDENFKYVSYAWVFDFLWFYDYHNNTNQEDLLFGDLVDSDQILENKFIAYKFQRDGNWYIGWFNLGFNSEMRLEISSYGYKKIDCI